MQAQSLGLLLALLLLHLLEVEGKLHTLKNIPVAASTLAGARGDLCENAASLELVSHRGVLRNRDKSHKLYQAAAAPVVPLPLAK